MPAAQGQGPVRVFGRWLTIEGGSSIQFDSHPTTEWAAQQLGRTFPFDLRRYRLEIREL